MLRFGSLRTRIIVFTTVPLITILFATLFSMITTANRTVRERVHHSLTESGSVFVQMLNSRKNELVTMAQVTVRDPRFFATFSIPLSERGPEFAPTLEGVAIDFLRITDADFLEIFDAGGEFIACVDRLGTWPPTDIPAGQRGIDKAMRGSPVPDFYQAADRLVVAAVAPVYVSQRLEAVVRLGSFLDDDFVAEVKRLTGADICLARDGEGFASTFGADEADDFSWIPTNTTVAATSGQSITLSETFGIDVGPEEYLTTHVRVVGINPNSGFDAFVARPLRAEFEPILLLQNRVAAGGAIAVLVMLLAGLLIARGITRPLSRIVAASSALRDGKYNYPLRTDGHDEVAELSRNFSEMRATLQSHVDHLEHLDQSKSNFIALASHELRTPLTIISGFNEMIASGALGEVPDKIQETAQVMNEHLTNLNVLVSSMLDLTYFEQGLHTFELVPTDLREIVGDVLESRRDDIKRRKLKLGKVLASTPVIALVDRTRMSEAILRIIDNAVRFTPDKGTVTISVSARDDEARVSVADTGVGIPPNELKWIFQKVYEVGDVLHHSSGKHSFGSRGFGLGLALCKAIVDNHNGRIEVDSTPTRGSNFTIVLALSDKPPSEKQAKQKPSDEKETPEPQGALT